MELTAIQRQILSRLSAAARPLQIGQLAADLQLDQSPVAAACKEMEALGWMRLEEAPFREISLGKEAEAYGTQPLPERIICEVLAKLGGQAPLTEIPKHCPLDAGTVGQSLRWLAQRGWARKAGDALVLEAEWERARGRQQPDEALLARLLASKPDPVRVDQLSELERGGVALIEKRRGFVVIKERTERTAAITEDGAAQLATAAAARPTVTQLTPELLSSGAWREVAFQPYDVTISAKKIQPGKLHPFQRTLDRVRRVFLEMGFSEVRSNWVESSFWDFDALFQPQDHPARDAQDTFYTVRPATCRLPAAELVDRVRAVHEDGGDTGSTGWGYRWSEDLAKRPVLRTHTTAATIRALARHATGQPGRYFVAGPVFRRETVDYKHLPVFHQVDGIIVDERASLSTLLGTLSEFYRKMGFPRAQFFPSFFPYTEPSVDVLLYFERRGEWVEMGGSGIFRPEVTRPLGIQQRVMAWGLGLERLAMMRYDLSSIGQLYFSTMPWLRETPLIMG